MNLYGDSPKHGKRTAKDMVRDLKTYHRKIANGLTTIVFLCEHTTEDKVGELAIPTNKVTTFP